MNAIVASTILGAILKLMTRDCDVRHNGSPAATAQFAGRD